MRRGGRGLQWLGDELGSFRGVFTLAGPFAMIVGALVALLFPELHRLGLSILALGAITLFILVLAWLLRPYNRVARRRQRYGLTAVISVLALVGIVSLVNLLAVDNNVLIDVTASRQYSLAPQTLNVLTERVQGEIEATAFIVEDGKTPWKPSRPLAWRNTSASLPADRVEGSPIESLTLNAFLASPIRATLRNGRSCYSKRWVPENGKAYPSRRTLSRISSPRCSWLPA